MKLWIVFGIAGLYLTALSLAWVLVWKWRKLAADWQGVANRWRHQYERQAGIAEGLQAVCRGVGLDITIYEKEDGVDIFVTHPPPRGAGDPPLSPKRKTVPKPLPDPRYVLGQLCYLDGAGYARCRVCFWGDGPPNTGMHSPTCVIRQVIAELQAMRAALDYPVMVNGHVERALTRLGAK